MTEHNSHGLNNKETIAVNGVAEQYHHLSVADQEKIRHLLAKYAYPKQNYIHSIHVCEILNISKAELTRWKEDGRLIVAHRKEFRKWGKVLESDYFDPKDLLIDELTLENWRLQDKGQLFSTDDEKRNAHWNQILAKLRENGIIFNGKWYKVYEHDIDGFIIKTRHEIKSDITIDNFKGMKATINELLLAGEEINIALVKDRLEQKIASYALTPQERVYLLQSMALDYKTRSPHDISSNTFNNLCATILQPLLKKRQAIDIINLLQIDKYEQSFPVARSMKRNIHIITGPTNSGKTWQALETLKQAKSGVYLAPLRLLALEIYEKLIESGVPCNLVTGEEHIIDPLAQHTASTVEMMNMDKPVEVAVIDEFQMLYDQQRGWAWTAALTGVPAKDVFIVGSKQALPISQKLFEKIEETTDLTEKERLSPLSVENKLVSLNDLKKGDAIIAFSRKDVLSYASLLRKKKFKVSTIYGALSPEVRRHQAELFANGTHDIVVSTDAIGMGLNLPITRVLFATIEKYDGVAVRRLTDTEIHQIAGRAGRYGIHEKGFVSLLQNKANHHSDLEYVKKVLEHQPPVYHDPLNVAPNHWHIQQLSNVLKEKNLKKILIYFSSMTNDSIFQHANLEHMCLLYDEIVNEIKPFSLITQYKLVCAPVNAHETDVVYYYQGLLNKLEKGEKVRFHFPGYTRENSPSYLEQAELDTKKLTLFMWLSHHFDLIDTDNVFKIREALSIYVSRALTRQNTQAFSKMIGEDNFSSNHGKNHGGHMKTNRNRNKNRNNINDNHYSHDNDDDDFNPYASDHANNGNFHHKKKNKAKNKHKGKNNPASPVYVKN
jgi:ATP-dependent RNA helicase SUPV3L1/SUV3